VGLEGAVIGRAAPDCSGDLRSPGEGSRALTK
jgi:hypothetical protein